MMKNKIIKFLLIIAILFPALGTFFIVDTKAEAAVTRSACMDYGGFEISSVVAEEYVNINGELQVPKVMPGDSIDVTVNNSCDTNSIKYNIFVHPAELVPDGTNIIKYQKVSDLVLPPTKHHMSRIKIYGTDTTGTPSDYKIRVVAYLIGLPGEEPLTEFGTKSTSLRVASVGIEIAGDSSIKKDDKSSYVVKFYNNSGTKFSIYIDSTEVDNRKIADVVIPNDNFTYSGFTWNTTGTEIGNHKIIVQLENGNSASFDVEVTDPSAGGGEAGGGTGGKTFPLSQLDAFNLKNLLKKCSAEDLGGVTCLVTTVTEWLLDIGAVIAFIMILYASIIYLTSYGEESKVELAKKTLIWSVIGVAVIGAAWAIMKIIENLLNNPSSL